MIIERRIRYAQSEALLRKHCCMGKNASPSGVGVRKRQSSTISLCRRRRGLVMLMEAFCQGTRRASRPDVATGVSWVGAASFRPSSGFQATLHTHSG